MAKIKNYKSCPLKKRPIVYVDEEEQQNKIELSYDQEVPQDLSLKRQACDNSMDYGVPAKRECALNLLKTPEIPDINVAEDSDNMPYDLSTKSATLSPKADILENQPIDIHLRGLTAATTGYTNNPYRSAFVNAAGCNAMTSLWMPYQSSNINNSNNKASIFPSPASSIASFSAISPRSAFNSYHGMTPPLSPGSEYCSEPEDLTMCSDIPLPALYHSFDESSSVPAKSSESHYHGTYGSSSVDAAMSAKNYRFKCDKCNKMYSTLMGLSKHQQFHCPAAECNQEKKQHTCDKCGKLYTTIGALKMHIRTHTLPCKCPICGKAFSRPWLLQGHIRTHTGEKPFQCPDCPRSFADRSNLRAHQQTHVDVKKYACKVCQKSFSRMSLLNKHANSNCTITIV